MSAETPAAAPKKSSKKLIVIAAAILLLGAGGAGAAWFFMQRGQTDEAAHAPKKAMVKKPLFTPLEPFTVNLQDARGERFAQIGVTLQIDDPEIDTLIKDRMPAVRNQILLLITSKSIDDLLTAEGKKDLAQQIRVRAAQAIGVDAAPAPVAAASGAHAPAAAVAAGAKPAAENPVKDVLFSQFIVQ